MSEVQSHHPAIELAWKKFAELDANAEKKQDEYMRMRKWIAALNVVAVLFAILVDNFTASAPEWFALSLKYLLIATPLISSGIAAFGKQFQQGQQSLAIRSAAEEILKEIYLYRTVMQQEEDRHKFINERLAAIQRNMFKSLSGELVLKPYKGNVPPYYDPNSPYSDPGFTDIGSYEYMTYRLEDQLNWHNKAIGERQKERRIVQSMIIGFGIGGAFLAAIGGGFAIWVALTAALASAFAGWEELRGLDEVVANYSRVILELNILRDHWYTMDEREQNQEEFYNLVKNTEGILWSQHSQWLKAMQENYAQVDSADSDLFERVIQKARETDQQMQAKIAEEAYGVIEQVYDRTYERVALGVEDSAADVKTHMARISDEAADGFEVEASLVDETLEMEAAFPADGIIREIPEDEFVDEVFADDEGDAFEAALEEEYDIFTEVFEMEIIEEIPEDEFVDEVFDDPETDDTEGVG